MVSRLSSSTPRTQQLNRGGILFNFEKHAAVFGWMYFFLIFIDRWITALSGNGIFVFFADRVISADYTFGVGWATIFMLLSAGTFEINLASISFAERAWDSARLGLYDKEGLVKARRLQKRLFYRAELMRFMSVVLVIFAITSAFVLALSVDMDVDSLIFYAIGVAGYVCVCVCAMGDILASVVVLWSLDTSASKHAGGVLAGVAVFVVAWMQVQTRRSG